MAVKKNEARAAAIASGAPTYRHFCNACGRETTFRLRPTSNRGECVECKRLRDRAYGASPKGRAVRRANSKAYEATPKGRVTSAKKRFQRRGLLNADGEPFTLTDYKALYEKQGGLCGCGCGEPIECLGKKTHTDHDHYTDHVRGLLAAKCNRYLHAHEHPEVARRFINYLGGLPAYLIHVGYSAEDLRAALANMEARNEKLGSGPRDRRSARRRDEDPLARLARLGQRRRPVLHRREPGVPVALAGAAGA